jgi:uroporphyrinogen-III synthase
LPEDTGPLRAAVDEVIAGRIDVALFTTSVQIRHLFEIAEGEGKKSELKAGMERVVKASIGPTTSETLREYGLSVDLEASHPKMGFLVKEAAERAEELVRGMDAR